MSQKNTIWDLSVAVSMIILGKIKHLLKWCKEET
jgi:hypothetical protein